MKYQNSIFEFVSSAQRLSAAAFVAALIAGATLFGGNALAQSAGEPPGQSRLCILLETLGGTPPPQCIEEDEPDVSPEVQAQLDALRLSVMGFFNYDIAVAAGWDTILGGCVESPAGGMGYHVHNMDQLLNGYLNLLRPEVLLYSPTEDGSMEFGGVEYIIPAELWESEDAPEFLGRELTFNPHVGPAGSWTLHVWVGKKNEAGIFEDFNPDVSCQFAADE